MEKVHQLEPIIALASGGGVGAIALIRISGEGSIKITNEVFYGKDLEKVKSHTLNFGTIRDGDKLIDEVLVSVFRTPNSYTKEDSIEISCHGSRYIIEEIIKLFVSRGVRIANPGEFTQRAFMNGGLDLVQAEAVGDLIAADTAASHQIALSQMRGGFSKKLSDLRQQLINFASMVELELDFGEEEVEFADRDDLKNLVLEIQKEIKPLIQSFDQGNVIKEGLPVAIIGLPNAGKSTLLNALLNEEKAIVTDIPGTTRDTIEDTIVLGGKKYRLIDTAGIRETNDQVEKIGIERSKEALKKARLVVMLYENADDKEELEKQFSNELKSKEVIWVRTKADLNMPTIEDSELAISAKTGQGINELVEEILSRSEEGSQQAMTLTNLRHLQELEKTSALLDEVLIGLESNITGDFLAQDIRLALHHLGSITGVIDNDIDILGTIFGKFCIGK